MISRKSIVGSVLGLCLAVAGSANAADPIRIPLHNWTSQLVGAEIVGQILEAAGSRGLDPAPAREFQAVPGRGIRGQVQGRSLVVGNARMLEELGIYSLVFGFCTRDEQIHAPNEFFRLSSFATAQKAFGILLDKLADIDGL